MQSNKMKLRMAIRAAGTAAVLSIFSQPALAQSTAEVQAKLDDMQRQIDQMVSNQSSGGWVIPGTDTAMTIRRYVKLDMIADFDQDMDDMLFEPGLKTGNEKGDTSFRAHARQSRLRIGTSTPTDVGTAKTTIEADFFGGGGNEILSNSRGLRIRHAYGELNGLLAGQTWSNFMHFTAYPATVELGGPVGVSFIRQAQLRYTMPVGDGAAFSVSAENPEATGFEGSRDVFPDLTAKYKWSGSTGGIEIAGLARSLQTDDASATGDDNAFGYGVMAAGRLNLTDATTVKAGVIFGDGVGRYIFGSLSNDSSTDTRTGIGEAYIDNNGDLETIEAFGATISVSQQWTSKFSSSLTYGRVEGDQPSDEFPNSVETLQSVLFSNFYKVADPVTLGLELSYGDKELMNGDSGDNTRLQLAAQFSF